MRIMKLAAAALAAVFMIGTAPFMKTDANADGLSVSVTVDTTIMQPYFSANVADSNLLSVFQNQVTLVPNTVSMTQAKYVAYERLTDTTCVPPQIVLIYDQHVGESYFEAGENLAVTINGARTTDYKSYDRGTYIEHRYKVDLGYSIDYGDGHSGPATASVSVIWFYEDRGVGHYTYITATFTNLYAQGSDPNPDPNPDPDPDPDPDPNPDPDPDPNPDPDPDPDPDPNPDPLPDPDPAPAGSVNMFRLYNPNSGEHFYTSNLGERNHLASLGWNYEGIGWLAPQSSNTPVYRLYNPNGGEHHYTTSIAERNNLISLGWNDEGIGWYSDDARTVPLYRQYNPNAFANNHNYTTSQSENNWLVSIGWRAEGIGWYGTGRG